MRQFFDVVHQAVELPLPIHLFPASEGKAVEPFVVTQVAEHRFHRGEASAVVSPSLGAVDTSFHVIGVVCLIGFAVEERHLPCLRFGGCA